VIECDPMANVVVEKVASPDEFTMTVPSSVAPSKKLTVPVGDPEGAGETVAVKTTLCPAMAGLGEAVSEVVVVVAPTPLKGIAADWLAAKDESPE
jgi:hypothetical protein